MKAAIQVSHRMESQAADVAEVLKRIAHPTRLMLLCYLAEGRKSVGELVELCGASQPLVSQYLSALKAERLVGAEREGQFVFYKVADRKILKLLGSLKSIYCEE